MNGFSMENLAQGYGISPQGFGADVTSAFTPQVQSGIDPQMLQSLIAAITQAGQRGINLGQSTGTAAVNLAGAMSPFDQYRPLFAQQMQHLMTPGGLASTPGYAAGLEGVERTMAAQHYQGSGNMMAALQKYSGDFYNQQLQQLAGLAGAGAAPGAGASSAIQALIGTMSPQLQGYGASVTAAGLPLSMSALMGGH